MHSGYYINTCLNNEELCILPTWCHIHVFRLIATLNGNYFPNSINQADFIMVTQRALYELGTECFSIIKWSSRSLLIFELLSPLHTSVPSWSNYAYDSPTCSYLFILPLILVSVPVTDKGSGITVPYKPWTFCGGIAATFLTFGTAWRLSGQLRAPATLAPR